MEKQTYKIPEGCKEVAISEEENRIVVEFVPEFKDGDVVKVEFDKYYLICFYTTKRGACVATGICYDDELAIERLGIHDHDVIKPATTEERQRLFSALEKEGYKWNAEEKKIEKLRWVPREDEAYFYMGACFEAASTRYMEDEGTRNGNCFQTKSECQAYCDYMKKMSLNYLK